MTSYGESTRAVHPPAAPVPAQRPTGLPVYRTASFRFDSAQEYADVLGDVVPGYAYSRHDNPTSDAFAAAVAALEGAAAGQALASGMAAVSTTMLALLSAGDHVVVSGQLYGGTYGLLTTVLPRFGVESTLVDCRDLDAWAAAVRPTTRLLWAETLANPTMAVADLPAVAEIAHRAGALLAVDSTFATPVVCRPLEYGADLVVHSATKYLAGHSDCTAGAVVGSAELVGQVRHLRQELGGMLSPDEAWVAHRGLATLPLRMRQHCESAAALAGALQDHPAVTLVEHPSLATSVDHGTATRLFAKDLYGAVVTVTPRGGREAGMAFCDRLRLVEIATSLGGVQSKVSHIASTTHRQLDDAALRAAGCDPGTVRVSVGLEDAEDLVADCRQALDGLDR